MLHTEPGRHGLYSAQIGRDGAQKWSFATGDSVFSSPAIAEDGTTYVGSRDGKLYAIGENMPVLAVHRSVNTTENSPVIISLGATDIENCDLTFSIVTQPDSGSLSAFTDLPCTAGTPNSDSALVAHTPDGGFTGTDNFTYKATDHDGLDSNTATVTVAVFTRPGEAENISQLPPPFADSPTSSGTRLSRFRFMTIRREMEGYRPTRCQ